MIFWSRRAIWLIANLSVPNKRACAERFLRHYYALFHLLSIETAKNWKRPADRGTLARMLDHLPMSRVCTNKRDELKAFKNNPQLGRDLEVRRRLHGITTTFVEMLQHRHTADYDVDTKWTRTDVLNKIQSVEDAFESRRPIWDEHQAQNFLVTLLLKERK